MDKKKELAKKVLATMFTDREGNRDLSSVYFNYELMDEIVCQLADQYRGKVDYVVAPESIGFVLGSMLARELKVGFVPIRDGAIPYMSGEDMIRASYIDHRDCARSLTLHKSAFLNGGRVLLADDWIGTAATMQACVTLMEMASAQVVGITAIGSYPEGAQKVMDDAPVYTILD